MLHSYINTGVIKQTNYTVRLVHALGFIVNGEYIYDTHFMLYIQYLHHCHFLLGNDLNVGFSISLEYARGFVEIRFCAYISYKKAESLNKRFLVLIELT